MSEIRPSLPPLNVSVVTYSPDPAVVGETLTSLARAVRVYGPQAVAIFLIDNGPGDNRSLLKCLAEPLREEGAEVIILGGHGNLGYGRGHDLALMGNMPAPYHLILNPDVEMASDALKTAVAYLEDHPKVVLVTPRVEGPNGSYQYLCKRRPGVLTLALRAFAPAFLRRLFQKRLYHYEMRDVLGPHTLEPVHGIPLASGCFMLLRTLSARAIGGFGGAYFLYFEDYDLSLRLSREGDIAYVPAVRIIHRGGQAGRKGLHHVRLFVEAGLTFFRRNGWRWG